MTLNTNLSTQFNHELTIDGYKDFTLFVSEYSLPTISVPRLDQPTPFKQIPKPGNLKEFSTFDVTFKVDEDLNTYKLIHDWLNNMVDNEGIVHKINDVKDGTLILKNNSSKRIAEIKFRDLWPTSLGTISYKYDDDMVQFITCDVSFELRDFIFESV